MRVTGKLDRLQEVIHPVFHPNQESLTTPEINIFQQFNLGPQTLFACILESMHWNELRASPGVLYRKPESRKRWKDVNSGQQGRSLYSSFIYRLKPGFGRFFRGACNRFWNDLLRKNTQVWENDVLMITGLQAYKTTRDALR
jgi:hypothetical protein